MTSTSPTPGEPELDPAQVAAALTVAAQRVCTLLDSVTDSSVRVRATPGWTVAELARHVAFLPGYNRGAPRGVGGWTPDAVTMPEVNARNIETRRDLSPGAAAERPSAHDGRLRPGHPTRPRRSSLFAHTRAR